MATPSRRDVEEEQQQTWSGSKVRGGGVLGRQPSPSPAKARQAQRRYRSLYHQAAKEYWAWREGENDSQRALGSVFHLLDRLQLFEPDQQTGGDVNLGGLEKLPGCRELLILKHTTELERVMRLWRALVRQMRGQVSRVEELLAEGWQLHRSDPARALLQPRHPAPPSPSPPLPTALSRSPGNAFTIPPSPQHAGAAVGVRSTSASHTTAPEGRLQRVHHVGAKEGDIDGSTGNPRHSSLEGAEVAASPQGRLGDIGNGLQAGLPATGGMKEGDRAGAVVSEIPGETARAMAAGGDRAGGVTTMTVGPAEHLQWLGDLSSMLVHEQWRKEVQSVPAP
ncbi:expressed unknown protein [Ectocarpus siliculosus]|uniref:Uncharacterized protein n=1 Tax=Ectocarpus siliculosus TaxID=2880 RepID=D7FPK5_ECTSI|nr:expressed unknown protein [Ectocarpus siliculosus]|eukprot:CBJ30462.1 expressed unknown protein [Ectocarpus siliculosus]